MMASAEIFEDDALFGSAHAALMFAFHYSSQQYDPPAMAKLLRGPTMGSGKGLVGLDGAAQSGMVRAEVMALSALHQQIVIARIAPRTLLCACGAACCAKKRPNPEWAEAISNITDAALGQLSGCMSHYRLRRKIVEKCFGVEVTLSKIADECGVNRDTAGDQHAKIRLWLKGDKPTSDARKRAMDRKIGEEERAWAAIGERLMACGLVR